MRGNRRLERCAFTIEQGPYARTMCATDELSIGVDRNSTRQAAGKHQQFGPRQAPPDRSHNLSPLRRGKFWPERIETHLPSGIGRDDDIHPRGFTQRNYMGWDFLLPKIPGKFHSGTATERKEQ